MWSVDGRWRYFIFLLCDDMKKNIVEPVRCQKFICHVIQICGLFSNCVINGALQNNLIHLKRLKTENWRSFVDLSHVIVTITYKSNYSFCKEWNNLKTGEKRKKKERIKKLFKFKLNESAKWAFNRTEWKCNNQWMCAMSKRTTVSAECDVWHMNELIVDWEFSTYVKCKYFVFIVLLKTFVIVRKNVRLLVKER